MNTKEIDAVKTIVNELFCVDIDKTISERRVVDARKIYAKILREKNYRYQEIADSINKNHATIIHYIKNVDMLISYDKEFKDKYIACKNITINKSRTEMFLELYDYLNLYEQDNGCLPKELKFIAN